MSVSDSIKSSIEIKQLVLGDKNLIKTAESIAKAIIASYKKNKKTLWCGNGGSAADAQHLAAELSGKFLFDREPLPSEALHVNTSYITAVANDYSYDVVYSRLIKAIGVKGDVLVGISTSGNSKNIINALIEGRKKGMIIVGFTGEKKCAMDELCDFLIKIPSTNTARIQECYMLVGHAICEIVEKSLFKK